MVSQSDSNAGAAEGLRNRGGTEDMGPRTDVGHSNGGAAPSTAEGHAEEGAGKGRPSPPASGVQGPGKF